MASWHQWHGFKGDSSWKLPKLVASSSESNRADQGNTIKANEYLDNKQVLKAKVKIMAEMIKASKLCCAYTGAGLSRSSGIPDYATKASNSVVSNAPKLKSNLDAEPTYAHCALTTLERAGYLKHYVQQNHDGLPQKSGFPQEKLNEIHGAWYDPSNPVVQFSGKLRGDLFDWMAKIETEVDLCLCLGTSLSGMNADRMASTPAKRSLKEPNILGTIIVNIQQTHLDKMCAIRIFGKLDEMLAEELKLGAIQPHPFVIPKREVFEVPYNIKGKLDRTVTMTLDLREKMEVYIPVKGASNYLAKGVVIQNRDDGDSFSIMLEENGRFVRRLLGVWWIYGALHGTVPQLPIINVNPVIIPARPDPPITTTTNTVISNSDNNNNNSSSSNNNNNDSSEISDFVIDLTDDPPADIKLVQSHHTVEVNKGNQHKWSLSLADESCPYVSSVHYYLHPTFTPSSVLCTEAPFTISRLGWGTFVINAEVALKPEYLSGKFREFSHELSFNTEGDDVKVTSVQVGKSA